ncbi:hypothetical protein Tco_1296924 [Tanacetum coccineum]
MVPSPSQTVNGTVTVTGDGGPVAEDIFLVSVEVSLKPSSTARIEDVKFAVESLRSARNEKEDQRLLVELEEIPKNLFLDDESRIDEQELLENLLVNMNKNKSEMEIIDNSEDINDQDQNMHDDFGEHDMGPTREYGSWEKGVNRCIRKSSRWKSDCFASCRKWNGEDESIIEHAPGYKNARHNRPTLLNIFRLTCASVILMILVPHDSGSSTADHSGS